MPTLSIAATFLLAIAQATSSTQPAPSSSAPAAPTAKTADVPTPSNAKQRMELAEKVNGLGGLDLPWHLKATYEVLAPDGTTQEKGTYEEWHGTGKQYRVALHSPVISVEEYGSEQGVFRTGAQDWPMQPVGAIRQMINQPAAPQGDPGKDALQNYERKIGPEKLQCTAVMPQRYSGTAQDADSFCFASTNAALLYASTGQDLLQTLFQHLSLIHGQLVAHDTQVYIGGIPWLKVHVDLLQSLPPAELTSLMLPAGARNVSPRVFAGSIPAARLLSKVAPQYPSAAKLTAVQGMVILDGVVDTTGHFVKLVVLAGPPLLQQAALDAVRQWVYQPYSLNGQPAEVETTVKVIFNIGH